MKFNSGRQKGAVINWLEIYNESSQKALERETSYPGIFRINKMSCLSALEQRKKNQQAKMLSRLFTVGQTVGLLLFSNSQVIPGRSGLLVSASRA